MVEAVAKVATAAARLAKPPPAPKAPVAPPFVAFVIELSIATETVWLAFAPTWNEAEAEPAAVTMVSFAAVVRSVMMLVTVPLAWKPLRFSDTPRVLKLRVWVLEPEAVIAAIVTLCEIVCAADGRRQGDAGRASRRHREGRASLGTRHVDAARP